MLFVSVSVAMSIGVLADELPDISSILADYGVIISDEGLASIDTAPAIAPTSISMISTEAELRSLVSGGGTATGFIMNSITLIEGTLVIPTGANIALIGLNNTISITPNSSFTAVEVLIGAQLSLANINMLRTHGGNTSNPGVLNRGHFQLLSGEISGHRMGVLNAGGAVFEMHGGIITANIGDGAVINMANAIFNMHDGAIRENPTVGVSNQGTFTMENGKITQNNRSGLDNRGTFIMNNGEISRNSTTFAGGGIFNMSAPSQNASITINGGVISHNTAAFDGGGIWSNSPTGFVSIQGGQIINNTAGVNGGGIWTHPFLLSSLTVGANVVFSGNQAAMPLPRLPEHDAIYYANIHATQWTTPFTQGLNNLDISVSQDIIYRVSDETSLIDALNNSVHYEQPVSIILTNDIMVNTMMWQHRMVQSGSDITLRSANNNMYALININGGNCCCNATIIHVMPDAYLTVDGVNFIGPNNSAIESIGIRNHGHLTLLDGVISGHTEAGVVSGFHHFPEDLISSNAVFNMYGGLISGNKGTGVINNMHAIFNMHDGVISENENTGVNNFAYATFNMYNGLITENRAWNGGGVVNSHYATFNMHDGVITGNRAVSHGGGVMNGGNSTVFNMYGGVINENIASFTGGGVSVSGYFNMYGGEIINNIVEGPSGNNAARGGGVGMNGGIFTMHDGIISGNRVEHDGGGVFIASWPSSLFRMEGGIISDNIAERWGGGVSISAAFEMTGGEISNNTAESGGGVFLSSIGSPLQFIMHNGTIKDNYAYHFGGGILSSGCLTIYNGEILNNKAHVGGGINVSGNFTMTNGIISGNTASFGGGLGISSWSIFGGWSTIHVGANVRFEYNEADVPINRPSEYDAWYNQSIFATLWTDPFTQGFNNFDIGCESIFGEEIPFASIQYLSFNLNNTPANPVTPPYLQTIRVVSDTPIMQARSFPHVIPTREGYEFTGWYVDPEFTSQVTEYTWMPDTNLTIHARWEATATCIPSLTNIAHVSQGTVMTASSVGSGRTADRANNGILNVANSWMAASPGQEYLQANFGVPRTFNHIRIFQGGSRITRYQLQYSHNGSDWNTFHQYTNPTSRLPEVFTLPLDTPIRAQYVRILSGASSGAAIVIWEFEVYFLPEGQGLNALSLSMEFEELELDISNNEATDVQPENKDVDDGLVEVDLQEPSPDYHLSDVI